MRVAELPHELSTRPTPFLAIDVSKLDSNIRLAQTFANDRNLDLRPHVKTHKIAEIAARQVAAGARGLTVSSLGEAECFASKGFDDIFVAYSVPASRDAVERISRLLERTQLRMTVDSLPGVESWRSSGLGSSPSLEFLIEVNAGLDRSGATADEAAVIAARAARLGFNVAGAFTYPGHGYSLGGAPAASIDEQRVLNETAGKFVDVGLDCRVRSGGSTPTLYATQPGKGVTEIRPGVYALNDAQQVALGPASIEEVAVFAISTVVSVPDSSRYVIDAGSKCIASDRPNFVSGHGLVFANSPGQIERLWEHHAVVPRGTADQAEEGPRVGDRVIVVPNHVCTAMNLQREVVAFEQGETETWQVFAGQVNH